MDLGISGLASGFDWRSLVDQLIQVERQPEQALRSDQSLLQRRNDAFGSIKTQLGTLQTQVAALQNPELFDSRTASSSDNTASAATAEAGTALGTYSFTIDQLATAAVQQGRGNVGAPLSPSNDVSTLTLAAAGFAQPVTAGVITVNGKQLTLATSDTLQGAFDKISAATGGQVTATYDASSDEITLSSASPILLGSATDTSNFLQAAKLFNSGAGTIVSTGRLGAAQLGNPLNQAHFATAVSDGGSGAGAFMINGVSISFNAAADSLANVITRINQSSAGVTASYDAANDRFLLTNQSTGDVGISLEDVTGNFLAATGLTGGTLNRGSNLLYHINGGGALSSPSNTIAAASSGLTGLSVTVLAKAAFSITVGADTAKIKSAITGVISAYNSVQALINTDTASSTDASGKVTAGLLASDPLAEEINRSLRDLMTGDVDGLAGTIQRLDSLGFASNGNDDSLSTADTTQLDTALANHLSDLKDFFTHASTGLAVRLNAYLNSSLGDSGSLVSHQNSLTAQSTDIDTQISNMERLIQTDQESLIASFTQMETAQANINQQLQFLQKNLA